MAGYKGKVNPEHTGGHKTNNQKINLPQSASPKA